MLLFHGCLKETVKPKSEVLISLSVWTLFLFVCLDLNSLGWRYSFSFIVFR